MRVRAAAGACRRLSGQRRSDERPRVLSAEQQLHEEEDAREQREMWERTSTMPHELPEFQKLASEIDEAVSYDGLDPASVARRIDLEADLRAANVSWEDLALRKSEQRVFEKLGIENPALLKKRLQDAAEMGVAPDPEDVAQIEKYTGAGENPILTALGQDSTSMEHLVEVSRAYYELARMIPARGREGLRNMPTLKLNRRVDEDKMFARNRSANTRRFVRPEELDETAPLPLERDERLEANKKNKCHTCWCRNRAPPLDPMNVHLLLRFMNLEGRLLPRRQTNLCAKWQRKVAKTVRRAKHLGLFSYKHGRFTVTDPFNPTLSHEEVLDELAKRTWETLYPKEAVPSFKGDKEVSDRQ